MKQTANRISSTMKIEAIFASETWIDYHRTMFQRTEIFNAHISWLGFLGSVQCEDGDEDGRIALDVNEISSQDGRWNEREKGREQRPISVLAVSNQWLLLP
jgi:hypothetical protein